MVENLSDRITENVLKENLKKFSDLDLSSHYDFSVESSSTINNFDDFISYIKSNKPIVFTVSEDNMLYYKLDGEDIESIFEIDVTNSFSKSDFWLYDKIIQVPDIFPNVSSTPISEEQTGCYICLTIASVFGDVFEEELLEVGETYNFLNWEQESADSIGFFDLATNWVQIGSKYVKMVAAAARFSLLKEKTKKQVPLALQLPQATVLALNKLIREINTIRFEYDELKLSPENRTKMSKLDVKIIIRERDLAIESKLKEDTELYQIWRLMHLNSNVIPPTILLRINREARKSALQFFKDMNPGKDKPESRDLRIEVKKVEDKFKRTVRRAYLNKRLASETEKYLSNPKQYVAPDFV